MRLIDATKAIESIDEIAFSMSVCISTDYCHGMTAMKDAAIHAVERQPTVDAVPVVRCRDCRFHIKEDDFEYYCNGFCQPARLVNPDDYCSRGMLKGCTIETCGYCENGLCYRTEDAPKSRNCPFTKGEANGKG